VAFAGGARALAGPLRRTLAAAVPLLRQGGIADETAEHYPWRSREGLGPWRVRGLKAALLEGFPIAFAGAGAGAGAGAATFGDAGVLAEVAD